MSELSHHGRRLTLSVWQIFTVFLCFLSRTGTSSLAPPRAAAPAGAVAGAPDSSWSSGLRRVASVPTLRRSLSFRAPAYEEGEKNV